MLCGHGPSRGYSGTVHRLTCSDRRPLKSCSSSLALGWGVVGGASLTCPCLDTFMTSCRMMQLPKRLLRELLKQDGSGEHMHLLREPYQILQGAAR